MTTIDKAARAQNNVTNLADVRQARAQTEHIEVSTRSADGYADKPADSENKSNERHGNRRFDAEKVARIKAAIASGEYVIDPSRVADRFIEHDRNQ